MPLFKLSSVERVGQFSPSGHPTQTAAVRLSLVKTRPRPSHGMGEMDVPAQNAVNNIESTSTISRSAWSAANPRCGCCRSSPQANTYFPRLLSLCPVKAWSFRFETGETMTQIELYQPIVPCRESPEVSMLPSSQPQPSPREHASKLAADIIQSLSPPALARQ